MSPTPNSPTADLQQANADLQRQVAEARAERDESEAQKAAIAEVLGVINSSPGDLAPVFDAILERAMRLCEAAFGVLWAYEGGRYRAAAVRGAPPAFAEFLHEPLQPHYHPGTGLERALRGENLVINDDMSSEEAYQSSDPMRRAIVDLGGARSHVLVALRKDEALLGAITIYRQQVRPFSDKQIALLQNFAAQAVISMENARLITETREALEQQTATAEVLLVINSSPGDLKPVFDAMLKRATQLCEAKYGLLATYDATGFHGVAAIGLPMGSADALTRIGHPPAGTCLGRAERTGRTEQIVDISAEPAYAEVFEVNPWLRQVRTNVVVPMLREGRLAGAFILFREAVAPFSDKQIALLQNFAAQAVIAIENARLLTETREALDRQTATAEVLQVINSSPGDLAPVFDAMLERAMHLCDAAFGELLTYDGERFRDVATRGVPPAFSEYRRHGDAVPGPGSLGARVLAGERVIHVADLKSEDVYRAGDQNRRALVDLGGARAALAASLRKDDAVLGFMILYRQEVRPFTDKQTVLLQNFAAQAVIAIENARLLTETREALEQQTATAEVLGVINSSPGDLRPVFDAMLERAMRLCDGASGMIWTFDGERLRLAGSLGHAPETVELLRQQGEAGNHPLLNRVLGGEHLLQVHLRDHEVYQPGGTLDRVSTVTGMQTVVWVAMLDQGAAVGIFGIGREEARQFTEREIALLQNFAAQAVIAIKNARLLIETREALAQQTATAEVLGVINSSPGDLAPVFDAILDKAHDLCGAAYGGLMTFDGEAFRVVAAHGDQDFVKYWQQGSIVPPEDSPLARVMHGAAIVHISDAIAEDTYRTAPALTRLVDLGRVRTCVIVPLRKDDVLLGVITAYRQEVHPFAEKQISLLENFAAQAVIAMENARLLGELHQRTDEVAELNRGLEERVAEQVDELGRVGRLKRFLAPQLAALIVSQGDEKILESHRRDIVVVFCDLRGYTAFTETAEPEEVLDFLREYHGALGPLVSQFEGTLDQFSGDGIMVFFNDPVPCPDPAERAVKMAMAMREAAGTLIADWRRRDRELGFGAGIAQGYATLGQIGFAERSGYTAIGTVCNLAARLCAEARDGQILIAGRVAAAVEKVMALEDLGSLALKGLTQPVSAFNVPLAVTPPALRVIEGGPQSV